jgi:pyruvate formate lyase activating enzyme
MTRADKISEISKTEIKGRIFSIERYAINDGPGIRTLVFLKGCPLSCLWCFNPEGQSFSPEVVYYIEKCINCNICVAICPQKAIKKNTNGRKIINSKLCNACGLCIKDCPPGALKLYGQQFTVKAVLEEIKKDIPFYRNSDGGVTLSGGEPISQSVFAQEILKECQKVNIHTAIETSGYQNWKNFQKILKYVDLVLYDIKHMNPKKHRELTGVTNELILSNAIKISSLGIPMIIRLPIIPSYNDSKENIENTKKFIGKLKTVQEVDLLFYKPLGVIKYERLGRKYKLKKIKSLNSSYFKNIKETIENSVELVNVSI